MARLATSARASNSAALARIRARLEGVGEPAQEKAAGRALISLRRRVPKMAKDVVRDTYAVQPSALSDAFDVRDGRDAKGTFLALRASVRPISLIRFGGRWRKRSTGATAEIERGHRKEYQSAFIATFRNGARHIVARGLIAGGKRAPRFPLIRLSGPSAYQMVQGRDERNAQRITEQMVEFSAAETMRQLKLARRGVR